MHGRILTATVAAIALIGLPQAALADGEGATERPGLQRAVLAEMNDVREQHGLRPLSAHRALERAALEQSRYLARGTTLNHDSADGGAFWTRLVGAGYPRTNRMAENLALMPHCRGSVQVHASRVVRMWMESPGHRDNLLDRNLRHAGLSVVSAGSCHEATVYTADLGG